MYVYFCMLHAHKITLTLVFGRHLLDFTDAFEIFHHLSLHIRLCSRLAIGCW